MMRSHRRVHAGVWALLAPALLIGLVALFRLWTAEADTDAGRSPETAEASPREPAPPPAEARP